MNGGVEVTMYSQIYNDDTGSQIGGQIASAIGGSIAGVFGLSTLKDN
jgi:hypothetical protein